MKTFIVLLAAVAAANGYLGDGDEISEDNIQPLARFVRQGYGSAGGQRPIAPVPPSYGGGGSGNGGYGSGGPVSFGGGYGSNNQGYNRPSTGGYGGGSQGPAIQPVPGQYGSGGDGGYGRPQRPAIQPVPGEYGSKPVGGGGYGSQLPQTGGPGYGPPPPVVESYKEDSYSAPPSVQPGYGVPEKAPTGPVGYGR